jgi:predicted deacylase
MASRPSTWKSPAKAAAAPPTSNVGYLQVQCRAPLGGFFHPSIAVWDRVEEGQPLGVIRDRFGQPRHKVEATRRGRIVFLRTFPRVLAGDPLCTIIETDS